MANKQGLIIGAVVATALFAVMAKARAAPPPSEEWCCDGTGTGEDGTPVCFTNHALYLAHLQQFHSITITGVVYDNVSNPLNGAVVHVYDSLYQIELYTSDWTVNGVYSISVIKDTTYVIVATCTNYYEPGFDPYQHSFLVSPTNTSFSFYLTPSGTPPPPTALCCDICTLYGDSFCVSYPDQYPTQQAAQDAINAHKTEQHTASISGNLLDSSGQVLNGVILQLLSVPFGKGLTYQFDGSYHFDHLIPYGTGYQLIATKPGYRDFSIVKYLPPANTTQIITMSSTEATWCCPVCQPTQCFMTWALLQNHIALQHATTACQYCGQGPFTDLQGHIAEQHPETISYISFGVQDKSGHALYGTSSNPLLVCFDLLPDPFPSGTGWGKRCTNIGTPEYYSNGPFHLNTYYILTATLAGYADYTEVIMVTQDAQQVLITMTAIADNYLTGVVSTIPWAPLSGVTVTVQGKQAATDGNGSYTIHGLTLGSNVRVDFNKPGYASNWKFVTIGTGVNHCDCTLIGS
jgi:hypothetical protein